MKKLIMMLAFVVAAVAANAATVIWGAQKGYLYEAGTTTKITSGDAYLMMVTSTYTQNDLVAAFNAAGGDAAATLEAMGASGAMATGAGVIGGNARITGSSTYNTTSDMTGYFVVFNGGNMYISATGDGVYDAVTGELALDFTTAMSTSSKLAAVDAAKGYAGAGWYGAAAVPEPTSGLLMLVGLAGLALRRRRA